MSLDHVMLRALIHEPEALIAVRDQIGPEHFAPASREMARRLWAGLPPGGIAGELMADSPPGMDWIAEALGAARRMVERRLKARLAVCRERLAGAGRDATSVIMLEIDGIARELRAVSQPATAPVLARALDAGWERCAPGGRAHWFAEHRIDPRCRATCRDDHRPPDIPGPEVPTCRRCVRLLAADLVRCALSPEPQPGGRS